MSSRVVADDEISDENDEVDDDEGLQEFLNRRTFVVSSQSLLSQPHWVSVSEVFRNTNDAEIMKKAGIKSFEDPRFQTYSDRLKKLRAIKHYVVHVLERAMSYEEVTEIFVRVKLTRREAKVLRSSTGADDIALAQPTKTA